MVWVRRDFKAHAVLIPCHGQGCYPPAQAAEDSIQPVPEQLQGWGIHSFSGQLISAPQRPFIENFSLNTFSKSPFF